MKKLDFGKELIKIREVRGLTQAEVAEKCHVTIRTIQRIESGTVKPRSSTIKIISKALEVDFFETSNQNSKLKNHTTLWYLKDVFNLKTNAMKKISILSTSILLIVFVCINTLSIKAQPNSPENQQKSELKTQDKKVVFSKKYDEFKIDGNLVWTLKNNKHGLVNLDGKVIIPNEYDKFEIDGNFVSILKNNKIGLMNLDGKIIIPCEYDKYEIDGNFVAILKNNKIGLMNLDGKIIIPCEYDKYEIDGNFVAILKNSQFGLMNLDGKIIIPCEYDTMKIKGANAIVTKNGKTKRIQI